MWAQLVAAALGVWLMAAPDLIGFGGIAADVLHIVGPMVVSVGVMAASQVLRNLRYVNVALAAILVVTPFVLGYPLDALLVSVLTALPLVPLSFVRGSVESSFGGGWSALFR